MKREYSILHISDLHKDSEADYQNLLSSLRSDSERYAEEGILNPEIIVVSGDLIEGSRKENSEEAADEIRKQYKEVRVFLEELVDYFLDGDKERIIIVPGNHDVFRSICRNAMQEKQVNPSDKDSFWTLRRNLNVGGVRWHWGDFKFYEIHNQDIYASRFDLFVEFYNSFYGSLPTPRIWTNPCEKTSQLMDLPEYNICFLGLNSCFQLDHLNDVGCIYPNAVTDHQTKMSTISKRGSLIVAVWHHHTTGLPYESNYLDYRILKSLIAQHVKIGLYGHQHMSTVLSEYNDLTQNKKMYLFSSGTLYGNRSQLQTGYPRQYSILNIRFDDSMVHVDLRVRKDSSTYSIPQWTRGMIGDSPETSFKVDIELNPLRIDDFIALIENDVRQSKNYKVGWLRMKHLLSDTIRCQRYMDSYLLKISDNNFIIDNITDPHSDAEFISLLSAAVEARAIEVIEKLRADERFSTLKGGIINYLMEEINKIIRDGGKKSIEF